jgi:septum formation protein
MATARPTARQEIEMTKSETPRLILASNSPRRRELLAQAGYAFEVISPDPACESQPLLNEPAEQVVVRLAIAKAKYAADSLAEQRRGEASLDDRVILAADTVAECGGLILGKPADREHARRILRQLRGQTHRVLTGVCLWPLSGAAPRTSLDVTTLAMQSLGDEQIESYLDTGLWQGKAGAFGYQDGMDWVRIVRGSPSNVVGLPLELLTQLLGELN